MAKVSVIVPVLRHDELAEGAIASVKMQTYADIELIVIDDSGATGAAAARNRGLEQASGEFVAFCDSDDLMPVGAVEWMVRAMKDADMVVGSFRKFGNFEQSVAMNDETMTRQEVAEYCMGNLRKPRSNQGLSGCWAKLYRRDLIGRFPPLTTAEDMAFNYDYLKRCEKVRFLGRLVYHNRKRDGSLSTTFNENDKPGLFGFLPALRYVRTFLEEFYGDDEIEAAIDNSKVYHSLLYFMRICHHRGRTMKETLLELYP